MREDGKGKTVNGNDTYSISHFPSHINNLGMRYNFFKMEDGKGKMANGEYYISHLPYYIRTKTTRLFQHQFC